MRPLLRFCLTALPGAVWLATTPGALAQWGPHESGRVPLTSTGEPDFEAATPRTADGKPDLTGVWQGVGVVGGQQQQQPPTPTFSAGPPVAGFLDVGQNVEGGLPFRPEGKALFDERRANNGKDNPEAHCLPMGIMQFHTQGAPRKFIQTRDVLVILYEASMGIRQIFTDARSIPTDDPQPWWYGYSVGHWEDDTLVVETAGFRDDGWLDVFGTPLTDAAKVTERIRRPSYGRMEIDVTVDDPKIYTRPWTVRVNQKIMPDQELLEFVCLENQRFGKR
jgi:hypothetical protein